MKYLLQHLVHSKNSTRGAWLCFSFPFPLPLVLGVQVMSIWPFQLSVLSDGNIILTFQMDKPCVHTHTKTHRMKYLEGTRKQEY